MVARVNFAVICLSSGRLPYLSCRPPRRRKTFLFLVIHFVKVFRPPHGEASLQHSSGTMCCIPVRTLAWQHPLVAELSGTSIYPSRTVCYPTHFKSKPSHDPQSHRTRTFQSIDDLGKTRIAL